MESREDVNSLLTSTRCVCARARARARTPTVVSGQGTRSLSWLLVSCRHLSLFFCLLVGSVLVFCRRRRIFHLANTLVVSAEPRSPGSAHAHRSAHLRIFPTTPRTIFLTSTELPSATQRGFPAAYGRPSAPLSRWPRPRPFSRRCSRKVFRSRETSVSVLLPSSAAVCWL